MADSAAVSETTSGCDKKKMTHAERNEMKRIYMKARYQNPEIAALKRADATRRYHERVPEARYGVRGRRPKESGSGGCSAAAVIMAGAALGAAVAAIL
jgi:hypothetical protein